MELLNGRWRIHIGKFPRPFSLSLRISPKFSLRCIILVPLDVSDNDIKLNECYIDVLFCVELSVMKLDG
jgi:hypothetical protein